ncbi:hypothetical protein [Streptomyces vinaceus]|uniref:hypothetical protein n=1 Tax=Streptomyces vinaceus TaxID=1960 RepID=UPI0036B05756
MTHSSSRAVGGSGMSAAAWAERQIASVRDDPAGRLALMRRCYHGPFGKAPRHLPFRRAALSFMRWQLRRGLLRPLSGGRPGSPWWRAVNERILRDGCEAVALSGGLPGPASARTVDFWTAFVGRPNARAWYRAHNGSAGAVSGSRRSRFRSGWPIGWSHRSDTADARGTGSSGGGTEADGDSG